MWTLNLCLCLFFYAISCQILAASSLAIQKWKLITIQCNKKKDLNAQLRQMPHGGSMVISGINALCPILINIHGYNSIHHTITIQLSYFIQAAKRAISGGFFLRHVMKSSLLTIPSLSMSNIWNKCFNCKERTISKHWKKRG